MRKILKSLNTWMGGMLSSLLVINLLTGNWGTALFLTSVLVSNYIVEEDPSEELDADEV
jgi:hypothetical protein